MIKIEPASWLEVSTVDFGIEISEGRLLMPSRLYKSLRSIGVRSGEEFASVLIDFPSALAVVTELTPPEVAAARDGLLAKFKTNFPDLMRGAEIPSKAEFGMGALPPESSSDDEPETA